MKNNRSGEVMIQRKSGIVAYGYLHMHKISMARALVTNTQIQEVDTCSFKKRSIC
jgi:hypothetical protein